MNERQMPARDASSALLLGSVLVIAGLYALAALGLVGDGSGARAGLVLCLLLLLPARLAWRGDGRAGFWYALLSTLIVAHGLATAASADTRDFGVALLGAALSMFVIACAFARRRGLQPRRATQGD